MPTPNHDNPKARIKIKPPWLTEEEMRKAAEEDKKNRKKK